MMSARHSSTEIPARPELRRYGAPMLSCSTIGSRDASASLIARGSIKNVEQRFRLPRHVFRLAIEGSYEHGSTTRLGHLRPVPLPDQAGYVSFYPAGTDIVNAVVGSTPLTYLTLEIAPSLTGSPDAIDPSWLHPLVDLPSAKARRLLREIARELATPGPAQGLLLEASATLLMIEAARLGPALAEPQPRANPPAGLSRRQLAKAQDYLSDHIRGEVTLRDLAALIGVSPSHLCRAFRTSTGTTPHRWQVDRRLDQAKTLMLKGDAKLADVAVAVGFYDQAHFTATFRTRFGVTPGAWRREARH